MVGNSEDLFCCDAAQIYEKDSFAEDSMLTHTLSKSHTIAFGNLTYYGYTVKPVLSDHIQQDIFLAFQTGAWLLLHESSAESPFMR